VENLKPFQKGHQKLGGRKKGVKNASTMFNSQLKKRLPKESYEEITKQFKMFGLKPTCNADYLICKIILNAYDGHSKAMELVLHYAYGKPTEVMEIDNTVKIEFVNKTDDNPTKSAPTPS
jgi:hypothetical protein